ncbi:ABC transporter substrate-binding protein [Rhizobium pusense]|uniref:ABC transporter substrate-binding protein n=1 Tax=Agrobacterium pusense TaxID=648995 RepID=UPI000D1B0CFB|nr:ABC transporter substrate-binding protein [Agrobacterium pusense]MDH0911762.1 ABC transporter substrate-binding protein [Agrobacterium pusense]MDH1097833.1 ABC transporter substrate-binding protein [Agrobacterium pusense]MDH1114254.1 ABC transporter substrate-binding protein [Agrobacterium pusense]MDH2196368.1 ABC transporter substrate-binding protein [Agrobacterium pusense]
MRSIITKLAAVAAFIGLGPAPAVAAGLSEIRIDWATYNPVGLLLKKEGLLEKEFEKDGIAIRGCNRPARTRRLNFSMPGSLDFGSTVGASALVARANGNPVKSVYVYSRPEWTALVTGKDSKIASVADLKGKSVAVTRGTDPHIFLVRALADAGLKDGTSSSFCCSMLMAVLH